MRASSAWREFWDHQDAIDDAFWERHISHFLRRAGDMLDLGPEDTVLDIGSGSGHFALAVASGVREVHCVETSPRYAAECRARLADVPNAHVHLISPGTPGPYDGLGRTFTRINCLSVIQYFDRREDFEAMLVALKPVAAPGARLLVGDIRVKGSLAADVCGSLAGGVRSGMLREKLRLLWRMFRRGYRGARKARLMDYTEQGLLAAAARQGVAASFVDQPLTLNATRRHLLVRFCPPGECP